MTERLCPACQGTILPRAVSGADRGTCRCFRPGIIRGRSYYAEAPGQPPIRWEYEVEWEGVVLPERYATVEEADAALETLRQKPDGVVFRTPWAKQEESWSVRWRGDVLPIEFNSRGAAEAYLDGLRMGRKPV